MAVQCHDGVYYKNGSGKAYLRINRTLQLRYLQRARWGRRKHQGPQEPLRLASPSTSTGRPKQSRRSMSGNSLQLGTCVILIHYSLFHRAWLSVPPELVFNNVNIPECPHDHPLAGRLQFPDHSEPWFSQGYTRAGPLVTHHRKSHNVSIKWNPQSPEHDSKSKQVTRKFLGPSGLALTKGPVSVTAPIRK